jgi:hypothetical protein
MVDNDDEVADDDDGWLDLVQYRFSRFKTLFRRSPDQTLVNTRVHRIQLPPADRSYIALFDKPSWMKQLECSPPTTTAGVTMDRDISAGHR